MTTNNKPQYGWEHQKRRAHWARTIATSGGITCACPGGCGRHEGACQVFITEGTPWHLGHGLAHAYGGDGSDAAPWCVECNLKDGSNIGHARRHHPDSGAPFPYSRNWWPELSANV